MLLIQVTGGASASGWENSLCLLLTRSPGPRPAQAEDCRKQLLSDGAMRGVATCSKDECTLRQVCS